MIFGHTFGHTFGYSFGHTFGHTQTRPEARLWTILNGTVKSDQIRKHHCSILVTLCCPSQAQLQCLHNCLGNAGLLNECSCLASSLGVAKLIHVRDVILVTLLRYLSWT